MYVSVSFKLHGDTTIISQKYGATPEEYNKMKEEGKYNVYGGFLEYLSLTGDKELAKALGLPEEGVTPEVLNLVLANAPEIPYEKLHRLRDIACDIPEKCQFKFV